MKNETDYEIILKTIVEKLTSSKNGYYLSWWLRLDLEDKYSSSKINYELKKAVKNGFLCSKSFRHGVEYTLQNPSRLTT